PLEVDLADARLDQRQRESGVEFEHVVCDRRRHMYDPPERATAFLLDLEADELEDVVLVLGRRGQLVSADGQLGAARRLPAEADDRPTTRPALRHDHLRRLTLDVESRPDGEPVGVVARPLDEEGAIEAVRPTHAADRYMGRLWRNRVCAVGPRCSPR